MNVNNVLPADGVDDTELVVSRWEKLVKGVARMVVASTAGDVEPNKRSRSEHRLFERVASNSGNGEGVGRLAMEPSKLIVGFEIEIERFGISRQARAQGVTVFSGSGAVKGHGRPVDIEGIHLQLCLHFLCPCSRNLPSVIDAPKIIAARNIVIKTVWNHPYGARIEHVQCIARRGQRGPDPVVGPSDVGKIGHANE